jgi:hypothetical protein
MSQNAIGNAQPYSNATIQAQEQANQQKNQVEQQKVNNISPDVSLGLSNSPDSPFWNKF